MKVIMGADFGGYDLKEAVKTDLIRNGYDVTDVSPDGPITYQDAAKMVAKGVQSGEYNRGIAICGTGMGVSIICNKFRGVYAALCDAVYPAVRSVTINNTNVLCMGGFLTGAYLGCKIANAWLEAEHLQGLDPAEKEKCGKESLEIPEAEKEAYGDILGGNDE